MSDIELGKRAVACKAWRWMPGMLARLHRGSSGGNMPFRRSDSGAWWFPSDNEWSNAIIDRDAVPDLRDASTLGCLIAMVRGVYMDPRAYASLASSRVSFASMSRLPGGPVWYVFVHRVRINESYVENYEGETEAEAWVSALEAANIR